MSWPHIPDDVIIWFRKVFSEANMSVTEAILNLPSVREGTLDDALISALVPQSAPRVLRSGAIVSMDIHNIGGLRRLYKWEIADIAVFVFVSKNGKVLARKVAFLQSKRLYPENNDVEDEDPIGYRYGMNRFLDLNESRVSMTLEKKFYFSREAKYAALIADSDQMKSIENFSVKFDSEIYYLLYNPPKIDLEVRFPLRQRRSIKRNALGCRVAKASQIHALLKTMPKGRAPTFEGVATSVKPRKGWRLEEWAADRLLKCKVGRMFDASDEELLSGMVARRSGPIGAAIAINIELGKGG